MYVVVVHHFRVCFLMCMRAWVKPVVTQHSGRVCMCLLMCACAYHFVMCTFPADMCVPYELMSVSNV